jgi:hypothetical protein
MRGAVGIDFWVGTRTRLGPSVGYTRYAPSRVERCTTLGCSRLPTDNADLPVGVLSLGISLTFGAGDPL